MALPNLIPGSSQEIITQSREEIIIDDYSFFNYNDASLRDVHRFGNNIRFFFKPRPDNLVTDNKMDFSWMWYRFLDTFDQRLLLVDYAKLDIPPYNYQMISISADEGFTDNCSRYGWALNNILSLNVEQLQQKVREDLIRVLNTGKIISKADVLKYLPYI
jgi:hypothetical protein